MLIEQVEQAQKLQTEAEKEADNAMSQLEEFINEQERLVRDDVCVCGGGRLWVGVEQAQKLQTEAEKEADNAMSQLEEFINEQERLVSGVCVQVEGGGVCRTGPETTD